MRKPVLLGLMVVVVVLAGLVVWYITAQRGGQSDRPLSSSTVVLIAVQQADDLGETLVAASVVQIDRNGALSVASIPPELRVRFPADAEGSRLGTLEDLYRLQGVDVARDAVAGVLNLEIPFSVALSTERLAAMIDAVGSEADPSGASVDTEEGVATSGEETVAQWLSETPGSLAAIDLEQAILLRLVESVPAGEAVAVGDRLDLWTEDGSLITNLAAADVDLLLGWMASSGPDTIVAGIVPTVPGESGVGLEPLAIDTARMVSRLFRGIEFLSPEQIRVAVFNGNGARQLAALTGTYLGARGFDVVRTSNAESFEYERTYIVFLGDETKAAMLHDVLPSDVSVVRPDQFEPHYAALAPYVPVGTDVLVVLGAGFTLDEETGVSSGNDPRTEEQS